MEKYGEVAIGATELVRSSGSAPQVAWEEVVRSVFPESNSLQDKGCPRGAYLGLCEDGFITGIPSGSYTKSRDNKGYALRAVEILEAEPTLADAGPKVLWDRVMNGQSKVYNSQMHVVLALWQRGWIKRRSTN
jgi:hypothetical protein